jgi:hypothetical protein
MGLRCELCDDWLNIFQLSKLCETCYKTRTIIKAYSSILILKSLEDNFLIDNLPKLIKVEDNVKPEEQHKKPDGYKNINSSENKNGNDQLDYTQPETRKSKNNRTKM